MEKDLKKSIFNRKTGMLFSLSLVLVVFASLFQNFGSSRAKTLSYSVEPAASGVHIKNNYLKRCLEVDSNGLLFYRACSGLVPSQAFKFVSANTTLGKKTVSVSQLLHNYTGRCVMWEKVKSGRQTVDQVVLAPCSSALDQNVSLVNSRLEFKKLSLGRGNEVAVLGAKDNIAVLVDNGFLSRVFARESMAFESLPFYSKIGVWAPTIGVIGDSLTTGLLSKYNRRDRPAGGDKGIPVIGEIISLINNANYFEDKSQQEVTFPEYSWISGSRVYSFTARLKELYGQEPQLINKAYNGAKVGRSFGSMNHDLSYQVNSLNGESIQKWGKTFPDLVLMFIGANDLFGANPTFMTPASDFAQIYDYHLKSIMLSENTRVIIAIPPDVTGIRRLKEFNVGKSHGLFECKDVWKRASVLNMITKSEYSEALNQRMQQNAEAIRNLVLKYRQQYGDRIRLVTEIYDQKVGGGDVSLDCLHANPSTQSRFAEAFWKTSWWGEASVYEKSDR